MATRMGGKCNECGKVGELYRVGLCVDCNKLCGLCRKPFAEGCYIGYKYDDHDVRVCHAECLEEEQVLLLQAMTEFT